MVAFNKSFFAGGASVHVFQALVVELFMLIWLKWLLAALLALTAARSGAQSLTNSLRVETTPTNLRLSYSLANSNGAYFFLQNDQLNNLFSAGQVIASGIAAS